MEVRLHFSSELNPKVCYTQNPSFLVWLHVCLAMFLCYSIVASQEKAPISPHQWYCSFYSIAVSALDFMGYFKDSYCLYREQIRGYSYPLQGFTTMDSSLTYKIEKSTRLTALQCSVLYNLDQTWLRATRGVKRVISHVWLKIDSIVYPASLST